jgi:hypothetical protein
VELRLLYEGTLLGSSDAETRAGEKHKLRKVFHPQLRRLWEINPHLDILARTRQLTPWTQRHPGVDLQTFRTNEEFRRAGVEAISYDWERAGYNFVPLVTNEFCLRCSLDILFLRPEEPRYLMNCGDLDARLKTVFDSLRIPANLSEAGGTGPGEDETPFFCLLADDKLISEVSVTSDQLLVLPKERSMKPNDVFLVIHVKLKPTHREGINWVFE